MTRTRQEIFDIAWNGLKSQGFEQSVNSDGDCVYRGPDGLRCALGHCIPDNRYRKTFEGIPLNVPSGMSIRRAARISEADQDFVGDLQCCHDDNPAPDEMEGALRDFALRYSLVVPSEPVAP